MNSALFLYRYKSPTPLHNPRWPIVLFSRNEYLPTYLYYYHRQRNVSPFPTISRLIPPFPYYIILQFLFFNYYLHSSLFSNRTLCRLSSDEHREFGSTHVCSSTTDSCSGYRIWCNMTCTKLYEFTKIVLLCTGLVVVKDNEKDDLARRARAGVVPRFVDDGENTLKIGPSPVHYSADCRAVVWKKPRAG